MSTSLLYHAFGATHYQYLKTEYLEGKITFFLAKKKDKQRCADCKSRNTSWEGGRNYQLQTLPIGKKPVILDVHLKKLFCKDCGSCRQEERELADPRKTYTRQLARYVVDLVKTMTLQDVADLLQMGWHKVRDIIKENLERKEKQRSWREVRRIAIDEIAVRKGHRYMTVVVDLDTGMVLEVVDGRKAESLKPVFDRLKQARSELEAVAMDMSSAFRKAVETYWPKKVAIVHDHFHVVLAMNSVVDEVRRDEQSRLDDEGTKVFKGNRYLLLTGWEKLEKEDKDGKKVKRLESMLNLNENLYKVYLLKEDLRQIWSQVNKTEAQKFLKIWIEEARDLNLRPVTRMANTIDKHQAEILAWYDYPISTGPLEGLNNKIKTFKRRAFGFRNKAFFRLRLLFIHETKFRLSGA